MAELTASPMMDVEQAHHIPEIDLAKLPRLNSSIWKKTPDLQPKFPYPATPKVKLCANQFDLSSDPITAIDFTAARENKTGLRTTSAKRKRAHGPSTDEASTFTKHLKITAVPEHAKKSCQCLCFLHSNGDDSPIQRLRSSETPSVPPSPEGSDSSRASTASCGTQYDHQTKFKTAEQALYSARDSILEASRLTSNRAFQTQILDFLTIFRAYTENEFKVLPNVPPETHVPTAKENKKSISADISPFSGGRKSYAQAVKAPNPSTVSNPTKSSQIQKQKRVQPHNSVQSSVKKNEKRIITLVVTKGSQAPTYQPTVLRDAVNKAMQKKAISRVHTSTRHNIVLTCYHSSPEELLESQAKWQHIFEGWPIVKAQKLESWPTVVVHGVPASFPVDSLAEEVSSFNQNITVQGKPRWLTGRPKAAHGSVVMTLGSDTQKASVLKSGILIGGLLLRAVNYQTSTARTLCRNCLKYGHQQLQCRRPAVCAFCHGGHASSEHSCSVCKSSTNCQHHTTQCSNCKATTHNALHKSECEFYKALL